MTFAVMYFMYYVKYQLSLRNSQNGKTFYLNEEKLRTTAEQLTLARRIDPIDTNTARSLVTPRLQ